MNKIETKGRLLLLSLVVFFMVCSFLPTVYRFFKYGENIMIRDLIGLIFTAIVCIFVYRGNDFFKEVLGYAFLLPGVYVLFGSLLVITGQISIEIPIFTISLSLLLSGVCWGILFRSTSIKEFIKYQKQKNNNI